ncbi:MAG: hypothetical protein WCJ58_04455 [bacterium]
MNPNSIQTNLNSIKKETHILSKSKSKVLYSTITRQDKSKLHLVLHNLNFNLKFIAIIIFFILCITGTKVLSGKITRENDREIIASIIKANPFIINKAFALENKQNYNTIFRKIDSENGPKYQNCFGYPAYAASNEVWFFMKSQQYEYVSSQFDSKGKLTNYHQETESDIWEYQGGDYIAKLPSNSTILGAGDSEVINYYQENGKIKHLKVAGKKIIEFQLIEKEYCQSQQDALLIIQVDPESNLVFQTKYYLNNELASNLIEIQNINQELLTLDPATIANKKQLPDAISSLPQKEISTNEQEITLEMQQNAALNLTQQKNIPILIPNISDIQLFNVTSLKILDNQYPPYTDINFYSKNEEGELRFQRMNELLNYSSPGYFELTYLSAKQISDNSYNYNLKIGVADENVGSLALMVQFLSVSSYDTFRHTGNEDIIINNEVTQASKYVLNKSKDAISEENYSKELYVITYHNFKYIIIKDFSINDTKLNFTMLDPVTNFSKIKTYFNSQYAK